MLECYYFHTFLIQYHLHLNPIPEVMESKRTGRRTDIKVFTFLIFTLALILILVESCKKDNLPPSIVEFSSDVQLADWGDVINLHVVANDPEQEALSYLWQVSGGTLLSDPSKRNVQWEMPNSDGTLTYMVEVRDAENIVSKSDSIQVISNPELVIVGSQELDFGTDRDSIHVFLANEGTGDLEWSILESELNIEWLESITPQSGKIHKGESQEVVIQINRTGQLSGIYTGIIKIESGGGAKNLNISMEVVTIPTVITTTITGITTRIAKGGGNVTDDGGAIVTARGVCWSTSLNPTTSNRNTNDGTGEGSFTSSLTALSDNTRYYVRSYATNSAGTAYGSQRSFKTLEEENGEWIQYDDDSFEGSAKIGSPGRLWMRFSMPSGWQAGKLTKVMINLQSSFSPFDIEACDGYGTTNQNNMYPSGDFSKIQSSVSQDAGWSTYTVNKTVSSDEFFITLYSNSSYGPIITVDADHSENFYRCGALFGNTTYLVNIDCFGIRIYMEEVSEPTSNTDLITNTHQGNPSSGIWLEGSLRDKQGQKNLNDDSFRRLFKQKK